jgi:uncharacterized protein YodC (DUF2158 family)
MTFKTGDIVRLKSGGPKMTVVQGMAATVIYCSWFEGEKYNRGAFPPDALDLILEDGEPAYPVDHASN